MSCEYCYRQHVGDVETIDEDFMSWSVWIEDGKLCVHDEGARNICVAIKYCPMCGDKLEREYEEL